MEYISKNNKRNELLRLAKQKALIFVKNNEIKLAKISFLNDCLKNKLYNEDFISNYIKYTSDRDITEEFFFDFN